MVKKGVIHQSSRPRTFIGVIQGVTRDLQAQHEAREQKRREDRLCESLRQTNLTSRPLSGGYPRDYDDGRPLQSSYDDGRPLQSSYDDGRPLKSSYDDGRPLRSSYDDGRPLKSSYDDDRGILSPSRPRPKYSSRPYRSPSPPPRYSSTSNAPSAGLQRSATLRGDNRTRSGGLQRSATLKDDRSRTRDFPKRDRGRDPPSRLSSVPENRQPHYRDLDVRAIQPGAKPRQVQLGNRTTSVSGRSERRALPPTELRGEYPPGYGKTRDSARGFRSGRDGYLDRESRAGRGRFDERDSYGRHR